MSPKHPVSSSLSISNKQLLRVDLALVGDGGSEIVTTPSEFPATFILGIAKTIQQLEANLLLKSRRLTLTGRLRNPLHRKC